jgi:uncharacterized membrane protein
VWEAIRWLHLLAMAFFVGGQLVLAAAVVPAFRRTEGADREPLRAIARHFGDWDDGTLHVKLVLVVLAGVLVAAHIRRPQTHALEGATFLVSLAIVWLGVALAH